MLNKIANLLVANIERIEDVGLLKGRLGAVVFLCHYSRYSKDEIYLNKAKLILQGIFQLPPNLGNDFTYGISGIGWGIVHLINSNFITDDDDDLLMEIEEILFENSIQNINQSDCLSVLHSGLFLLALIEKKNLDVYDLPILNLLNSCHFYLLSMTNHIEKPLILINSILYFLSKIINIELYKTESQVILFKLLMYLSEKDNYATEKMADKKILLKLLSQLSISNSYINIIKKKINETEIYMNTEDYIKHYLWQHLLYFPDEKIFFLYSDDFLEEINKILSKPTMERLFIYNGLAGIGLNILWSAK